MKKILIFLTPILIVAVVFGCSKDHSSPTYSTYEGTSSPENVEAVYNSTQDVVDVSWTMSDTSGVAGYFVSVSDSSVFEEGETKDFNTKYSELEFTYEVSTYYKPAEVDSLILYFTVSAIYKNETFNYFIGPRAEVDSALVLRR